MENCTCPTCRHIKGDISNEEYAWYLKGCIETATRILKNYEMKDENPPISWKLAAQYELDNQVLSLQELVEVMDNPDRALLHPESYLADCNE